jgi:hypothetical protein
MPLYIMTFPSSEDRNNSLAFNGVAFGYHTISIEIPETSTKKKKAKEEISSALVKVQDREVI